VNSRSLTAWEGKDMNNLANLLTCIRLIGVMVIFFFTPYKTVDYQCWTLLIYIILCLTDFLDGKIARSRWGKVTNLGKWLDPLADKLLALVYLPALEMHQITSGPVAIFLARDFIVSTARSIAASKGQEIGARFSGKIRTAISMPLLGVLLGRVDELHGTPVAFFQYLIFSLQQIPAWLVNSTIWFLCFWTIYSIFDYLYAYRHSLKLAINDCNR